MPEIDNYALIWGTELRQIVLGTFTITSGKLAVCDPFAAGTPVAYRVPNGKHAVIAAIAKGKKARCAAVFVAFRGAPVRWELAGTYQVDSGFSCFVDPSKRVTAGKLSAALENKRTEGFAWAVLASLVAVASGASGEYGVHLGYDDADKLSYVLTHFDVAARARPTEDWIAMSNKRGWVKRFVRKGKVIEDGYDDWMKTTRYATEAKAAAAFQRLVAGAKKQGFVDNAILDAKKRADEPLYMPETDYTAVLAGDGFTLTELGKLAVGSGKIIACDPFLADEKPLARRVPKGTYAVTAAIRRRGKAKAGVCAATFIRFAAGKVTRWVSAGDYGVDAGVGCFMDSAAAIDDAALSAELERKRTEGFRHAALEGVVAFQSGLGDGSYGSHWGLGKGGKVLCLITDFCV